MICFNLLFIWLARSHNLEYGFDRLTQVDLGIQYVVVFFIFLNNVVLNFF
jgi:hypothetical protein